MTPVHLSFGTQICGDLDAGSAREWLVADGLGGYAMGTVCGLRTRRYHGLLTVAEPGTPARRHLALASLDPVLRMPTGERISLATHEWSDGAVGPQGYQFLERFDLVDGLPRWRWRVGDVVLERELAMEHGKASVAVLHRLVAAPGPVQLALYALCTWRDAHGERHEGGGPLPTEAVAGGVVVDGAYRIAGPGWQAAGSWWNNAYHREEAARGLNASEDLWHPGRFVTTLAPGETMEVAAWAGAPWGGDLAVAPPPATAVIAAARERATAVVAAAEPADGVAATLALAADAFVVTGPRGPDVVAGYPWFGTWSRDTMISYDGLFLATGRAEEGRELLRGYAETLSAGMLANTADTGQTEFNTVDATLWFLHAVTRHVGSTGDTDLAAELAERLDAVVAAHVAGTRYGIRVDVDGLVTQGAAGYALTWMDARVDGVAVTPRIGKPVEINALWINGLGGLAELFDAIGRDAGELRRLRERAVTSFRAAYPGPSGWLHDVVDGPDGADLSLRPNQLLAYSLPYGPLAGEPLGAGVGAALLTPLGPRSLAAAAKGYTGRHRGGPAERDRAYHEGTVWPWLIGPYADAVGRSRNGPASRATRRPGADVGALLGGIEAHLSEWGLGSVSETAEGDAPHRATGCPFQAWSVAEVLRIRQEVG